MYLGNSYSIIKWYKKNHDNFIPVTGATCIFFISFRVPYFVDKKALSWQDDKLYISSTICNYFLHWHILARKVLPSISLLVGVKWNTGQNICKFTLFTYVNVRDFGPNHLLLWCKYKSLDGHCLQKCKQLHLS